MSWQIHVAEVNGKHVATSEPHEVPDDAPVGHLVPLDGHYAALLPDSIVRNDKADFLGREVRTRILRGIRRVTSVLPGPAAPTWAEANRHRILDAYESHRAQIIRWAPMFIVNHATKPRPVEVTTHFEVYIILFHAALLKLWDTSAVTDEHRQLLLELSESWDDQNADPFEWLTTYGASVHSAPTWKTDIVQKMGTIRSQAGATLEAAYPLSFAANTSGDNAVLIPGDKPPWRLI